MTKYSLCGYARFSFFSVFPKSHFFPPRNKQECNKNAENQGVDYPGKAVGVRKAFLAVFFPIHVSRAY